MDISEELDKMMRLSDQIEEGDQNFRKQWVEDFWEHRRKIEAEFKRLQEVEAQAKQNNQ